MKQIISKQKIKFRIHPLLIFFAIYLIVLQNFFVFFQYFLCVTLHEFCHAWVAAKKGYKLDNITLSPFGATLKLKDQIYSYKDEILIALAGPCCNLFLSIIIVCFWWIFPVSYSYTITFFVANMTTFLYNLLPAYPLDGGRIFCGVLCSKIQRKKAVKIALIFNIIFGLVLTALFVVSMFFTPNYTMLFCAVLLFMEVFDKCSWDKYSSVNLLGFFEKKKSVSSGINFIAVRPNIKLIEMAQKFKCDKYNLVYVITEDGRVKMITEAQLKKIFTTKSVTCRLEEVVKI